MTSPFPGMDPYLEGYLFSSVHAMLVVVIAEILAPKIAPKYVARIDHRYIPQGKVLYLEVKKAVDNQAITRIEILTPFLEKREELNAGVHSLEIDLIRRGKRPVKHRKLEDCHYTVNLTRAGTARTDIWGFNVKDTAPIVSVPLAGEDPDVVLNLGEALKIIYKRSMYHLSIDYKETPPPPAFDTEVQQWMNDLLEHV